MGHPIRVTKKQQFRVQGVPGKYLEPSSLRHPPGSSCDVTESAGYTQVLDLGSGKSASAAAVLRPGEGVPRAQGSLEGRSSLRASKVALSQAQGGRQVSGRGTPGRALGEADPLQKGRT